MEKEITLSKATEIELIQELMKRSKVNSVSFSQDVQEYLDFEFPDIEHKTIIRTTEFGCVNKDDGLLSIKFNVSGDKYKWVADVVNENFKSIQSAKISS